jgi:hypothetical protein
MMLHLMAALTIAAGPQDPAAIMRDVMRLQEEFKLCLIEQTVALGAGNTESADTVLRGVGAACLAKETELGAAYAQTPLSAAHVDGLMRRDRKLGEDAGVAALLRVRAQQASAD